MRDRKFTIKPDFVPSEQKDTIIILLVIQNQLHYSRQTEAATGGDF